MRIGFLVGHAHFAPHARLLSESILRLGLGDVYAMVPAHVGPGISIPGAVQIAYRVPEPLRKLPFADKILAAAAFEGAGAGDFLWMDVDGCFFRKPAFPDEFAILVNPVDKKNIGDAFGGPRGPLWRLLYGHFGLDGADERPVIATASGEAIYPYYNAGMALVREDRGLFALAAREMRALIARADVEALLNASFANRIFFHQAVYTCALLSLYGADEIRPLPRGVNYPMHLHGEHFAPLPPEEWVSVRYDTYFHDRAAPEPWREWFAGKENSLGMAWHYGD